MTAPENTSQYTRTLEAAKLSESTAQRWQRIARAWEQEAVEGYIEEQYRQDKMPTLQYLLREARKEETTNLSRQSKGNPGISNDL